MSMRRLWLISIIPSICRVFLLAAAVMESCWVYGQSIEVKVETQVGGSIQRANLWVKYPGNRPPKAMRRKADTTVYWADVDQHHFTIIACDGPNHEPSVLEITEDKWSNGQLPRQTVTLGSETMQVTGHVRYADGHPVPKAEVTMTYEYYDVCKSTEFRATADEKGFYRIAGLPASRENLRINVQKPLSFKKRPPIRAGEVADLTQPGTPGPEGHAGSGGSPTPGTSGGGSYGTHVDTKISFEATFAQRIFSTRRLQLSLEVPFVVRPSTTVTSDIFVKNYRALFFTPSARLTFLVDRRIYPWISVGAGLAHFVPGSINQAIGPASPASSTTSKAAFQSGAGVDFWPFRHLGFRTNIRNFYSGAPTLGVPGINLRNTLTAGSGILIR